MTDSTEPTETPDALMEAFGRAVRGEDDTSPYDVLHAILNDVVDSANKAANTTGATAFDVWLTVEDYVVNHYGKN